MLFIYFIFLRVLEPFSHFFFFFGLSMSFGLPAFLAFVFFFSFWLMSLLEY